MTQPARQLPSRANEQWRPVHGYAGLYEVSDGGQVRSLPRRLVTPKGGVFMSRERILKPGGRDYLMVALTNRAGVVARVYVHRLVLDAFAGAARGRRGRHRNENPKDNRLANLYWAVTDRSVPANVNRLKATHNKAQWDTKSLPGESWRPIAGYEHFYEVSDHGRVRALPRDRISRSGNPWRSRPRILREVCSRYCVVTLHNGQGTTHRAQVHRLVLEAFVGQPPPKHICRHLDGNDWNNRLTNLCWRSFSEMMLARAAGTEPPVYRSPMRKTT